MMHPKVNVYELTQNCGLGKVRDFGIEKASGEYIMFVDSDDWILPDTIEECVRLFEKHNVDLVEFGYKRVSQYIQEETNPSIDYMIVDGAKNIEGRSDHISCNKMFKTNKIKSAGIRFKYRTFEDTHFTRDYALQCKKAAFIDTPLYCYYYNPESLTSTLRINVLEDASPTDEVISVYNKHGYPERAHEFMKTSRNYLLRQLVIASRHKKRAFNHHPNNSEFVCYMKPWIDLYNKHGIAFRLKAYQTLGWKYTVKTVLKNGL